MPALHLPDPGSLSHKPPQLSSGLSGGLPSSGGYAGGPTAAAPNQAPPPSQPNQAQHFMDAATGQLYVVQASAPDQALGGAGAGAGGYSGGSLQAQAQIAHSVAMVNLAQVRC